MSYKPSFAAAASLIFAVSLIFTFTACGSTSLSDTSADISAAPQTVTFKNSSVLSRAKGTEEAGISPQEPMTISEMQSNTASPINTERKVVKHQSLSLETKEFDTALKQLLAAIAEQGGYIENQSVSGQSLNNLDAYYERTASVQARIPADKLDSVSDTIESICNVTSKSEHIDDITDSYFDTDAHLKSLKLQEERLLDILSKAEKLEDVITLEQALSEVRYQIESLTATIRRMDSQVAYSYLNLDLHEVVTYQAISSPPKTIGDKIVASFKRSGEKIAWFFEALLFFAIEDLPLIIIWLAIFGGIAFLSFKLFCFSKSKMNKINFKISRSSNQTSQDNSSEKKS